MLISFSVSQAGFIRVREIKPSLIQPSKRYSFVISPLFGMKTYLDENEVNLYVLNEKGYENLIKISYFISKNR